MLSVPQVEYSANVRIWLEFEELCLSVAQVGESSLVLADSASKERFDLPLLAQLITFIDDHEVVFWVSPRRRSGRVIYFESCVHEVRVREFDAVPF